MKSKNLIWLLVVALAPAAHAGTFTIGTTLGGGGAEIPDFDLSGYQSTITSAGNLISGSRVNDDSITKVTVTLNITGGYNGDLYGYLRHTDPSSATGFTVLLCRINQTGPGDFGSSGSGFSSVTLSDDPADSIVNVHNASFSAGSPLTGTYNADGSTLNTGTYDSNGDTGTSGLSNQNSLNGEGSWTLFLADVSGGSVSTLVSWSATITAVPEPVNCALGIFGALGLGTVFFRRKK